MQVQVNWIAILLATIASMALGAIWYAQPVFGKMWMKLIGADPKGERKGLGLLLFQGFLCALLTAYVLAHLAYLSNYFFKDSFLVDAIMTGLWVGLGISATTVITHNGFEGRPKKLTLLTVAHQIVGFLIMGVIIGVFKP